MLSISSVQGLGYIKYLLSITLCDYYSQGGEQPGEWFGNGATKLKVSGEVKETEFRNIMSGFSADGSTALVANAGAQNRQVGIDLTFSAPKSVSVLWGLGGQNVASQIERAHSEAVKEILATCDEDLGFTRRGKGGTKLEQVDLAFALFQHGTSRNLDPQLHTHAILVNTAMRRDGTWGTIVNKEFFLRKMELGRLYRKKLASKLEKGLGVSISWAGDTFEIAGIPKALSEAFSSRRREIEQHLEQRGLSSAQAAKIAALQTRRAKSIPPRKDLIEAWKDVGRKHGFTEVSVSKLFDEKNKARSTSPSLDREQEAIPAFNQTSPRRLSPRRKRGFYGTTLFSIPYTKIEIRLSDVRPFWWVPDWNPLKKLALPILAFGIAGRPLIPQKTVPEKIATAEAGPIAVDVVSAKLCPKAPEWSPVSKLSVPSLQLRLRTMAKELSLPHPKEVRKQPPSLEMHL